MSCESSAVLFMNSLWGARGNGDGIEASFCAAVCGRTPKSGMHVRENRVATIEVRIDARPSTLFDWDRLGYAMGSYLPPHAIPVLTGDFPKPDSIVLKTFFASLACSAGTEMCCFPGTVAFDSSKQRQNAPDLGSDNIFYGSRETCLKSAVSGHWEGM